jgi:hypothetical protein
VLRPAAAPDAGDQRDVRYQSVHRSEDGRPQPAARYVPVLVMYRRRALGTVPL